MERLHRGEGRPERERGPEHGTVYWLTGLAGAGKTTLGLLLARRLRELGRDALFLDGDRLRASLFPDAGYSSAERRELALRYSRLCGLIARQGSDVVLATISLHPEVWEENRRELGGAYREILVRAPAAVRAARKAELYASERELVVGRDEPAPEPPSPDARVENDGSRAPEEVVHDLCVELGLGVERKPAAAATSAANVLGETSERAAREANGSERAGSAARATKGALLERLAGELRSARVLPQVRFTVAEWSRDPELVLARIDARGWLALPLIVRSSARTEDAPWASLAGRFPSLADRRGAADVRAAIDAVARELRAEPDRAEGDDEIFVQPYLDGVRLSGVALTRDPSNGGRYTIVSYDAATGRTGAITSGAARDRRTYYRHASASEPPRGPDAGELAAVLALVRELEELLDAGDSALDVEFAFASDGALHLLQVRVLELPPAARSLQVDAGLEARALARVRDRLGALAVPHPYLYGARAVFGTMPDWNPAEVIGVRPRALALSLYEELVTDGMWAYQRKNYGYRDLRSFPLLVSLAGLPYVDVRVSFNSFLPADVDADLGRRLVDHYTERLLSSPLDHDKVEFAIVHSCYTLDLPERLRADLVPPRFDGRDRERLGASLLALTNRITAGPEALFRGDVRKVRELEERQVAFERDARELDLVARAFWLLEDCKRWGTLPFAGIARAAFIARQMLDSLVTVEVLTVEQRALFLRSLQTVRGRMDEDLVRLPRKEFLRRYGHLRPGTYDVTSPRYDETPDAYFDWGAPPLAREPAPAFALDAERGRRLDRLLAQHGLEHDAASLFAFVREATEAREHAKFVFSRSLSDALVALERCAARHGFSREDLAHADVAVLRRLHSGCDDPRELFRASIDAGRRRFALARALTLPPLVTSPDDALAFHLPPCEPNYVTQGSASGPVVTPGARGGELRGGIVLIPSADPGHDWIFSHSVAGFVTQYGGYNSHMAIRANELGIPAVIGAGETLYRACAAARRLRIDCLNRRVEVLA